MPQRLITNFSTLKLSDIIATLLNVFVDFTNLNNAKLLVGGWTKANKNTSLFDPTKHPDGEISEALPEVNVSVFEVVILLSPDV